MRERESECVCVCHGLLLNTAVVSQFLWLMLLCWNVSVKCVNV